MAMRDLPTTAHTPGPWLVDIDPRRGMEWNRQVVTADGRDAVCFMAHSNGRHPLRDAANARVVAASPLMLAVLQTIQMALADGYRPSDILAPESPIRLALDEAVRTALGPREGG